MSDWYNREGLLIPVDFDTPGGLENMQVIESLLRDWDYRCVAETFLPDGKRVSTVWLGLDHGFNFAERQDYRPVIFETMVFSQIFSWMAPSSIFARGQFYHESLDEERYSTEAEAKEGHQRMCEKWSQKEVSSS